MPGAPLHALSHEDPTLHMIGESLPGAPDTVVDPELAGNSPYPARADHTHIPGDPQFFQGTDAYWYRFETGLQIYFYSRVLGISILNAYGPLYQSGALQFNFEATFANVPAVAAGAFRWGNGANWVSVGRVSTTFTTLNFWDVVARSSGDEVVNFMATGRWKV